MTYLDQRRWRTIITGWERALSNQCHSDAAKRRSDRIFEPAIALRNVEYVAKTLRQQFDRIPKSMWNSHSALFLNDSFALGYYSGFIEEASYQVKDQLPAKPHDSYVKDVFACLLKNPSTAMSFVNFARSKRADIVFQKGYEAGVTDLMDWTSSNGKTAPEGLSSYFGRQANDFGQAPKK